MPLSWDVILGTYQIFLMSSNNNFIVVLFKSGSKQELRMVFDGKDS